MTDAFGLVVRDTSGRVVMDPGTFTVRLVDRFTVDTTSQVYVRPRVRVGMFCVFQSRNGGAAWLAPVGTVTDGRVTIRGVVTKTGYTNGLDCLVMGYV